MGFEFIRSIFNRKVDSKDTVNCLNCNKIIAHFVKDTMIPSAEECYRQGKVPVPNCGWFCSQECVNEFGQKNNLKFDRDEYGLVDYYNNGRK